MRPPGAHSPDPSRSAAPRRKRRFFKTIRFIPRVTRLRRRSSGATSGMPRNAAVTAKSSMAISMTWRGPFRFVSDAQLHGGPFPAMSDPRFTSVGSTAVDRFLRPVAYQNLPPELLPPALPDDNPRRLWHLRDRVPARV